MEKGEIDDKNELIKVNEFKVKILDREVALAQPSHNLNNVAYRKRRIMADTNCVEPEASCVDPMLTPAVGL